MVRIHLSSIFIYPSSLLRGVEKSAISADSCSAVLGSIPSTALFTINNYHIICCLLAPPSLSILPPSSPMTNTTTTTRLPTFLTKPASSTPRQRLAQRGMTPATSSKHLWWTMLSSRLSGKGMTWLIPSTTNAAPLGTILIFRRSTLPGTTATAFPAYAAIASTTPPAPAPSRVKFRMTSGMLRAALFPAPTPSPTLPSSTPHSLYNGSVRAIARPSYTHWTPATWSARTSTLDAIHGNTQTILGMSVQGVWIDRSLFDTTLALRTPIPTTSPTRPKDIQQTTLVHLTATLDATTATTVATLDAVRLDMRRVRTRYADTLKPTTPTPPSPLTSPQH